MLWALYSLLSGFFVATDDALVKKAKINDVRILAWALSFFAFPVIVPFLFFIHIPNLDFSFWLTVIFLVPLDIIAILLYIKAVRTSPLSLTVPFLSLTPVFMIATSFILLNEMPSLAGFFGILLVAVGAYTLNSGKINSGFLEPFKAILREKGSLLMILVAFIYSITANLGKIAVLHSNLFFFLAFDVIISLLALSIIFFPAIKNNYNSIKSNIKTLFFIGILNGLSLLFHLMAIVLVIAPYMISIKRTSSIFGVVYGHFLFKEKNIMQRLVGAAVMVIGAAIILISQ